MSADGLQMSVSQEPRDFYFVVTEEWNQYPVPLDISKLCCGEGSLGMIPTSTKTSG